jgi:hypothetical protein
VCREEVPELVTHLHTLLTTFQVRGDIAHATKYIELLIFNGGAYIYSIYIYIYVYIYTVASPCRK